MSRIPGAKHLHFETTEEAILTLLPGKAKQPAANVGIPFLQTVAYAIPFSPSRKFPGRTEDIRGLLLFRGLQIIYACTKNQLSRLVMGAIIIADYRTFVCIVLSHA